MPVGTTLTIFFIFAEALVLAMMIRAKDADRENLRGRAVWFYFSAAAASLMMGIRFAFVGALPSAAEITLFLLAFIFATLSLALLANISVRMLPVPSYWAGLAMGVIFLASGAVVVGSLDEPDLEQWPMPFLSLVPVLVFHAAILIREYLNRADRRILLGIAATFMVILGAGFKYGGIDPHPLFDRTAVFHLFVMTGMALTYIGFSGVIGDGLHIPPHSKRRRLERRA